jgi:hypothetical protein
MIESKAMAYHVREKFLKRLEMFLNRLRNVPKPSEKGF